MDEPAPIEELVDSTEQEVGICSGGWCGDGYCSWPFETSSNCATDCQFSWDWCGDGRCHWVENPWCCPNDCGFCGDGICNSWENSSSCASDCAPAGSVSASPATVYVPAGQLGTTTISWSAQHVSTAQVYVTRDSAPESLFAQGISGSQSAPWIVPGSTYQFKLYAGTAHSVLLDTVTVTGVVKTTTCGDGICDVGEVCFRDCFREPPCNPICP